MSSHSRWPQYQVKIYWNVTCLFHQIMWSCNTVPDCSVVFHDRFISCSFIVWKSWPSGFMLQFFMEGYYLLVEHKCNIRNIKIHGPLVLYILDPSVTAACEEGSRIWPWWPHYCAQCLWWVDQCESGPFPRHSQMVSQEGTGTAEVLWDEQTETPVPGPSVCKSPNWSVNMLL